MSDKTQASFTTRIEDGGELRLQLKFSIVVEEVSARKDKVGLSIRKSLQEFSGFDEAELHEILNYEIHKYFDESRLKRTDVRVRLEEFLLLGTLTETDKRACDQIIV